MSGQQSKGNCPLNLLGQPSIGIIHIRLQGRVSCLAGLQTQRNGYIGCMWVLAQFCDTLGQAGHGGVPYVVRQARKCLSI